MKNLYKFLVSGLIILAIGLFFQRESLATLYTIHIPLEGVQEVPPNPSTGLGALNGTYDDVTFVLSFTVNFTGLTGTTTAAHFHGPAPIGVNAPVVIGFAGFPVGVTSGSYTNSYVLTPAQNTQILAGLWYVNIHSNVFPGGELRGQLDEGTFLSLSAPIEGSQEVPPNASTGLGQITGTYNPITNQLSFSLTFTGLTGTTTAAHFHGPAIPGVNAAVQIGFAGFPVGVTSGAYSNTYILSDPQETQYLAGLWYVNVHTNVFPGGEIRGQLTESTLPVELTSFTSSVIRNNVTLKWSTAAETNNSGFDIERKLSSSSEWTTAGNIAGNGNSNELRNYVFSENVSTGVYHYRLKQIDFNGNVEYFVLSNDVNVGLPATYGISQNYPNPFNPTTKIDYELPHDGRVSIILFDLSGREVERLVDEIKTAGYYTVQLNANNLSSGVYLYKISAQSGNENFTSTKKLMLIK